MAEPWVMPTHIIAVAGVVRDAENRILLVNHHRHGWSMPGGQVEVGENLIDALKREIMEETGIEVTVGELFCIASNTGVSPGYNGVKEIPTKLMLDFLCVPVGGVLRGSDENDASAWFSFSEAMEKIHFPAVRERFLAYQRYSGRPVYLEYRTYPAFERRLERQL